MKEFFRDIFEYHHHFNQKLIVQLLENENAISKKVIPLLSHTINAHQIWNARITESEELGVNQIHTLNECAAIDAQNFEDTLGILNTRELSETVSYTNSKGAAFKNTVQQILFHISNHFSHHKGQIIFDLRQSGIAPLVTDYIFYKR